MRLSPTAISVMSYSAKSSDSGTGSVPVVLTKELWEEAVLLEVFVSDCLSPVVTTFSKFLE